MAALPAPHVVSKPTILARPSHPDPAPRGSSDPALNPLEPFPRDVLVDLFLTVPQNASLRKQLKASPELMQYLLDPLTMHGVLYDLASSANPGFALKGLNVARQLGGAPEISAYETIAYRLGAIREWDLLLHVISSAKHNTRQKTSPSLLDWRARALLETQRFTELERIFDLYELYNLMPSRRTWHLVLSGYIRNHDLAGAHECLQDMESAGFPADHTTHALVATLYQHIGPDSLVKERALAALPHIPGPAATAMMNSLMILRLRTHNLDEVSHLLSAFDQSKVGPLSVMLAASRSQRDDTATNDSVDHAPNFAPFSVDVHPDATTFSIFIDYFGHLHELSRCLAIFDHMLAVGIAPTPRTLTSLIRAYFLAGHGGAAVRLVAGMCDPETTSPSMLRNLPSPDGYSLPFDATSLGRPNRQIFNCLLRAALRTNGLAGGRAVVRLMRLNDVKPDSKSVEIITSHTYKAERAQPRVLMSMVRRFARRFTLQDAHVILASTLRFQKHLVHGIGWNVTAAKFSPTRAPVDKAFPEKYVSKVAANFDPLAGIELPSRIRWRGTFRAIEASLSGRGIKSDKATIAIRMRHEAVVRGDMNAATQVFQTLLGRGLHPNQYHYSALMEGFAIAGDFESAIEVMKSASRASFEPDVLMFTILIVGYARQKNPDMALQIFRRMVAAGIKPDVPSIDAVASAFFFVGAYTMCWRVLTTLWPHIGPLPPDIEKTSLQSATVYFRSLHQGMQQGLRRTSKVYRNLLHRRLHKVEREWKHWERTHPTLEEMSQLDREP